MTTSLKGTGTCLLENVSDGCHIDLDNKSKAIT